MSKINTLSIILWVQSNVGTKSKSAGSYEDRCCGWCKREDILKTSCFYLCKQLSSSLAPRLRQRKCLQDIVPQIMLITSVQIRPSSILYLQNSWVSFYSTMSDISPHIISPPLFPLHPNHSYYLVPHPLFFFCFVFFFQYTSPSLHISL